MGSYLRHYSNPFTNYIVEELDQTIGMACNSPLYRQMDLSRLDRLGNREIKRTPYASKGDLANTFRIFLGRSELGMWSSLYLHMFR